MTVKFRKELYSKNVLFKACYRFTDDAYVHLDADQEYYIVNLASKNETNKTDFEDEFSNQIIEEVNREIVTEQTKNIRQILFARSLASTVVYEKEAAAVNTNVEDKTAMKDWFKNG